MLNAAFADTAPGDPARAAFDRLVSVLERSSAAVVLAADATVSTGQAADVLGVSRMTVVRLIERGALTATAGGGAHRRIAATELARYLADRAAQRADALHTLASDIDQHTPDDHIIRTR